MFLLDTNHCFRIVARDPDLLNRLEELGSARISTSVIAAGELQFGASISLRREENLAAVDRFLRSIALVAISPAIAGRYGRLKAALLERFGPRERAKRRQFDLSSLGFNDNDLWIAASALDRAATLVTADLDFQRIAGVIDLATEDWTLR